MTETRDHDLSFDEFDEVLNPGPEVTEFQEVVETAVSRRGFLSGGIAFGAAAFVLAQAD